VTSEAASKLRSDYHDSMSKGQGAPVGNSNASKQNLENQGIVSEPQSTAAIVAKETGSSPATVKRDAKLVTWPPPSQGVSLTVEEHSALLSPPI